MNIKIRAAKQSLMRDSRKCRNDVLAVELLVHWKRLEAEPCTVAVTLFTVARLQ